MQIKELHHKAEEIIEAVRPKRRVSLYVMDVLMGLAIFICLMALILRTKEASQAAQEGIKLCLDVIVPSLFPFFVLSTLIVELGLARYLGKALERVMRPLFRVGGACSAAVVLGFIGGYPVGARTAIALYEKGECSKTEAERLLSFCNNSGPAFILGAVGAGIFSSSTVGWLLYLAHTAASLTVGLLFRFYKYREPLAPERAEQTVPVVKVSQAFVGSVRSSFNAILGVCSFVIFFAVAIRMLYVFGVLGTLGTLSGGLLRPFGIAPATIEKLLAGMIEVTSGLWALQDLSVAIAQKLAMAAFMLGWAGVSIHCQVLTFIGNSGLRAWTYVAGKMLHGVISTVYVILLMNALNVHLPVSSYLMGQMEDLTRLDFGSTLAGTLRVTAVISGVLVFWCAATLLKRNWKRI